MERNSFAYKMRRKGQVVAHKLFTNEFLSKLYYKKVLNKHLDLSKPRTFNEKIQWCKLYYYPFCRGVIECTDKYAVRNYLKKRGFEDSLTPLLGVWNNANEIIWDELPEKFVLKCNHGCAYNIVVEDKTQLDLKKTIKQLNKWLREDFGSFNVEIHYSKIKPRRIICEEYLGSKITDYKFFCFNGVPKYIMVTEDLVHDRQAKVGFFNLDGTKMELTRNDYGIIKNIELPAFYESMLEMARKISTGFPFVRVDFFLANGRYYFAELTFTPGAGMMPFDPEKYDYEWGDLLDISKLMN